MLVVFKDYRMKRCLLRFQILRDEKIGSRENLKPETLVSVKKRDLTDPRTTISFCFFQVPDAKSFYAGKRRDLFSASGIQ